MHVRRGVPTAVVVVLVLSSFWLGGCDSGPAGPAEPEEPAGPGTLTMYVTPGIADVIAGSATDVRIRVVREWFTGPLTIRAVDPPLGVTVDTVTLEAVATTATVSISVGSQVPIGDHDLTVLGEGPGGVTSTVVIQLRVRSLVELPLTVAAGSEHSCALAGMSVDNPWGPWPLYCWGRNDLGQLGDGTTDDAAEPVKALAVVNQIPVRFTQVVAGAHHTCALDAAGEAWCWGGNGAGQLGDGTTTDRLEPVPVQGGHIFVQLAAGGDPDSRDGHTCGLLSSGAALCWGSNVSGQLGAGAGGSTPLPAPVTGDHRFALVVAGGDHTCALAVDGRAWCWGDDALGQLGSGQGNSPVPVPVSGGLVFLQLAAGGAGGTHACGLAVDGGAYCWGSGAWGQLGNGSNPTQAATPEPVVGGRSYVQVAAGWGHTCGSPARAMELPEDVFDPNPPFCWGLNAEGQLGDGTTGDRVAPTEVGAALLHFMDIAAGAGHTCGREIGFATLVYCWGDNSRGQLGIGPGIPQRTNPVEVELPWW